MARDLESGAVGSQTLTNVEYIPVPAGEMPEDLEEVSLEEKDALESADEISLGEASSLGSDLELPLVPPRPPPIWVRYVKAVFWALVPSFLHPSDPRKPMKPLHPTAWLGTCKREWLSQTILSKEHVADVSQMASEASPRSSSSATTGPSSASA